MNKTDITKGISYLEVPEENLRILCGCPENSIKFVMQKGLTKPVVINGFKLVSGPNAILLSDISLLNSHFLNFSEFPVLHHQFFQGAAFNGTNEKFTLIGSSRSVENQFRYIKRGLWGLESREELFSAGLDSESTDKILAMGKYHKGNKSDLDIVEKVCIAGKTRIKGDLFIERLSINKFRFTYNDNEEIIDLNLEADAKGVGLPYQIKKTGVEYSEFGITTVGDGNGWNPDEPCMGSLITCKGKRYLVDSGPGSLNLLEYLGINPSELEGIFITHSHDDHFAGILSLLNSDIKLKFLATALVLTSVQKKLEELLDIDRAELKRFIDFIELKEGVWSDIGDMEVRPNYSFHTIETNVFYFRVMDQNNNWKTYGHINDIISRKDLDIMIEKDKSGIITKEWTDIWFNNYFYPCTFKRIDAGGGVVHGDAGDFTRDKSEKIILSHLNHAIDTSRSENFAPPTKFGYTEILIPSQKNYPLEKAETIVRELSFLLGKDIKSNIGAKDIFIYNPDDLILKRDEKLEHIYMVLSGTVKDENRRDYISGDFLYTFNSEKKSQMTFTSSTRCCLARVKFKNFNSCMKNLEFTNSFRFLRNCSYFTYGFSLVNLLNLSKIMNRIKIRKGSDLSELDEGYFFIESGKIALVSNGSVKQTLAKDSLSKVYRKNGDISLEATENSVLYFFSDSGAARFPSLYWSIFEENLGIATIVETDHI